MARKAIPVGPHTHGLIEDARIDLARAVLAVREGENEPEFNLPEEVPNPLDDESINAFRQEIIEILSEFDPDELRPAEQRCRRIRALADSKGITSLTTIVDKQFSEEQVREINSQPDPLCRSIWAFLNARQTFEDAESFHFARQFRDYGKLYDAFEVELEKAVALDSGSIDEMALAAKITKVLELKTNCTVKALDLPATTAHPASIMLIVRHGGPLSSVYDHRDDGRRGTIYFRPPNEATLIYTPSMRQIEVCADSPVVRQEVAGSFAEIALGHDVSQKPLTWKRYNLSRFRSSLRLDVPRIDGYEIKFARVLEAEVRLGTWSRKLLLKVAVDDDIVDVADRYLRPNNIFRRADGFSRIGIAISYNRVGDEKERTLNITISGTKSCNLQSNKDPEERNLGFALLDAWGILSAFQQIDPNDLRAMFPQLIDLHDRTEDEVSGAYLRELGLDPDRLIQGGLLERRGRQDVVLIDDDDVGGEAVIKPSAREGMVRTEGAFGEDGGERPASDLEMYEINRQWLHETVVLLIKPLLTKRASQILDPDLTLLGAMQIGGAEVPVYFGRRLYDLKTLERLDLALRARNQAGVGIVLAASTEMPSHLGPNVVVPLLSNLSPEEAEIVLARDGLELAFRNNFSLARGGATPQVLRSGKQSATLHVPGKDALALVGADQITIFERLVAANKAGSPDKQVKELMDGLGSRSPQQAFRKAAWESILNNYISKGAKRGYWRLVVDTPIEAPV
ncbi:hypothetical protein ROE7235_03663 [Roseibaca ekhonensis]|uniref:Uncharacterized protein n=1 Tax=Roseinatronobacter ekhonensis TaxID=254356 RepID=A0A3B0MK23_9RHOB|nr:hypothetical protein [Roseibaca ekhonensis]SUZ33888.1 hypothetical protein ROE7235_03663 [Roseibaca ekhonensis]